MIVTGCEWFDSSGDILIGTASFVSMYYPSHYVSAANCITDFTTFAGMRFAPLNNVPSIFHK